MSSSESSRRFHFIREIASGGFGSVYLTKVIHADGFSRLVAVKLLHPRWSENEEIASRMRDEARLLGWLRHKNIVDVMDLTLIDGRCAVIMEYLDAVDTKVVINHCAETKTRIPIRAALEICAAVASALDAAYNRPPYAGEKPLRVIHRDIKPSNIMVDESGVVKVLDFGVARAEFDERESKTQEMAFGSLEYMPPERLFFEPESPASDVYSLGATLYEMLALEKFGKAKLRPKEHEQYFEDRFDLLLDRYPLHEEAEKLLHELLMDMLEFDEPERPTAADCVTRLRAFARRIPEHSLEEWAEATVPTVVRETRDKDEVASPGSLVGTVLTEDARALDQRSIWDENTGMSTRALDLSGLDDEMTGSLADDARWKALKQATIEEMAKKGELGPARTPRGEARSSAAEAGATGPPSGDTLGAPENVRAAERSPGMSTTGSPPVTREKKPEPPEVWATPTPAPTQRFKVPPEFRQYNRSGDSGVVRRDSGAVPAGSGGAPAGSGAAPAGSGAVPAGGSAKSVPAGKSPITRASPPPPPVATRSRAAAPAKPRRGGVMVTVALMFVFGAALGLVVFAAVVIVLALAMMATGGAPPAPAPVVKASPPPVVAPAPAPVEITGPHATFTSGRADTEKFKVSCTEGSADGVDSAMVAGEKPGTCRVQAITGGGERLSARVENVEPREYVCFVGDSEDCK